MAYLATCAFAVVILGLFALERDRKHRTSRALWIPTAWVLIAASRFVSEWTSTVAQAQNTQQQIDGSPVDRAILTGILLLGVVVLLSRGRRVLKVLRMNSPILLFFAYCFVSILWSGYPDVSFKRWVKGLGDLVMVLIVLTERDRTAATKRLLARVAFLLIPVSALLIEYFPSLGQSYSLEMGTVSYTGVAMNKNSFGLLCLIVGLASVWRLTCILRIGFYPVRRLVAHGTILAMTVWLLVAARSATALACFLLGSGIVVVSAKLQGRARSARMHLIAGSLASAAIVVAAFPDAYAALVHALGRNTTLTDRTELWHALLGIKINPWVGTGFASFWMGNRLDTLWSLFSWQPNEAHNGYLGMYLNLGLVGISLLAMLLITGYRNAVATFRRDPEIGSLMIGLFVVAVAYNVAEDAFRLMDPIWIFFLMAIMNVPSFAFRRESQAGDTAETQFADEPEGAGTRCDEAIV